jgi:hypothetical protein
MRRGTGVLFLLAFILCAPATARPEPKSLFDGKTLDGWEGDTAKTWRVEDGSIVGGSLDVTVPRNEFLCTKASYENFELKVKFKLLGDPKQANGGVQFRTKRIPNHHEVSGFQADIGQGYWGALYDESRRNKVLAGPDKELLAKIVKQDEWNDYTIRAEGPRIRLWLNGTLTVDYTEKDEKIERSGIIGLQIHGGAKAKVYYKDIRIEELPADKAPGKAPEGKSLFDGKTLAGWKVTDFGKEGKVEVVDGAIVMERGKKMTGVTYAKDDFPKMDYELTFEGKKIDGEDFFATTTFPVADSFCSLVLGGWGGQVVGLSNIDGQNASENETTTSKEFKKGQWYKIRLRVTATRIQAWIDEKQYVDQDIKDRRLSLHIFSTPSKPLGFATWDTTGAVRDIKVRPLTDEEKKAAGKK